MKTFVAYAFLALPFLILGRLIRVARFFIEIGASGRT